MKTLTAMIGSALICGSSYGAIIDTDTQHTMYHSEYTPPTTVTKSLLNDQPGKLAALGELEMREATNATVGVWLPEDEPPLPISSSFLRLPREPSPLTVCLWNPDTSQFDRCVSTPIASTASLMIVVVFFVCGQTRRVGAQAKR